MARRRDHRPGLTLLEVLLVTAIILVLGTVATLTMSAWYGDVRVKAAADQVQSAWTEARTRAIEEQRPYRFSVEASTGKFRVAPDGPEFWDGSGGGSSQDDENAAPPYIEEGELAGKIVFEVPSELPTEGSWTTVAIFNPDGTCQNDTEITLREHDDDGVPIVIRVRAMTGAITVKKKPREEQ
jgi:prepilin-type N-terminal cleavage/methylation domain-containing protein